MGTLTGNTPSLPEHCPHKLPTSCRLTATTLCCVCQDQRAHRDRYSTYEDGIGLVNRGTRWKRYCYFCSEFWSNRVAATDPPMDPSDSRIPDIPDQKPFLDAWHSYHRGFRLEPDESVGMKFVECTLERPWREVDPGHLPLLDERARLMILRVDGRTQPIPQQHVSLDNTLDELMVDTEPDSVVSSDPPVAVGDERQRLEPGEERRRRIEARTIQDAERILQDADRRCTLATLRKQRAVRELDAAEVDVRDAQTARRLAGREHRNLVNSQQSQSQDLSSFRTRTAQQLASVWGTREDMEQQGVAYTSPLTTLFTRAYERYQVAEEVRAEDRREASLAVRMHEPSEVSLRDRRDTALAMYVREHSSDASNPEVLPLGLSAQRIDGFIAREGAQRSEQERIRTLDDAQDHRPPPKTEEELKVKLECKVCLQQVANVALLPCGHLILCSHCAAIVVPPRAHDHTVPTRGSRCPLCKKNVSKRVQIIGL